MNPIDILIKEHQEILQILNLMLESKVSAVKTREKLVFRLDNLVALHSKIEESLIYTHCKNYSKFENFCKKDYNDHDLIGEELKKLLKIEVNDENWLPKIIDIKSMFDSHFIEEEGMLQELNRMLTVQDSSKLAKEILIIKQKHFIK